MLIIDLYSEKEYMSWNLSLNWTVQSIIGIFATIISYKFISSLIAPLLNHAWKSIPYSEGDENCMRVYRYFTVLYSNGQK